MGQSSALVFQWGRAWIVVDRNVFSQQVSAEVYGLHVSKFSAYAGNIGVRWQNTIPSTFTVIFESHWWRSYTKNLLFGHLHIRFFDTIVILYWIIFSTKYCSWNTPFWRKFNNFQRPIKITIGCIRNLK